MNLEDEMIHKFQCPAMEMFQILSARFLGLNKKAQHILKGLFSLKDL